jgi:hypothetical protein
LEAHTQLGQKLPGSCNAVTADSLDACNSKQLVQPARLHPALLAALLRPLLLSWQAPESGSSRSDNTNGSSNFLARIAFAEDLCQTAGLSHVETSRVGRRVGGWDFHAELLTTLNSHDTELSCPSHTRQAGKCQRASHLFACSACARFCLPFWQ